MKEIVQPLLSWFKENKRDLEWRQNTSAYSILISEVMLQQTRVEAVRPFYHRFMKELPNFLELANCPDEKLMKLWEGLGYYSRARNLKKCAQEIVSKYNGNFPDSYTEAIKLPGIGMYTCGAILSRAYNKSYAAVDGNVLRVLSRYLCFEEDILKESTKQFFKKEIEKIMPSECGAFNESLMELGATICMPKVILCEQCPIHKTCKSYQSKSQTKYPIKENLKEKKIFEYTLCFVTDGKNYIFVPKENGVLKNLPSPFLIDSFCNQSEAMDYIESLGFYVVNAIPIKEKKHVFTHQIWYMKAYKILVHDTLNYPSYTEEQILNELTISSCFKKFLNDIWN